MSDPVYRGFGAKIFPPGATDRAIFNYDFLKRAGLSPVFDKVGLGARQPFEGITTNGEVMRGLFPVRDTGISPAPIVAAAKTLLDAVGIEQKARLRHRLGDLEERLWTNAFLVFPPHGLLLDDVDGGVREKVCAVLKAAFSARGFSDVRTIMRFNAYLGELIGDGGRNLTEWMYYFTLFDEPSDTEPWGWQLMGHHLCISCFILGGQMVMSPLFLGAEPCVSDETEGPYVGLRAFEREEALGLEMVRGLSVGQQDEAVLHRSMYGKMPPNLDMSIDGRMRSVTGADNAVIPYEGIGAAALSPGQREKLLELLEQYVGRLASGHHDLRMEEVRAHLDQTWFAWVGEPSAQGEPFYYKVQSPVILIEFDHHSGVFLDNREPQRFHAHAMVRTPNGGDYGIDLLRQHYAQFEHTEDGRHVPRSVLEDPEADHRRAHVEGHAHSHLHGHAHDHGDGRHHHDPSSDRSGE